MAPRITNLETIRDEYFENGEVLHRTTREWATSIKLAVGSPARCDIVNGGPDKIVNLLVPSHVNNEVTETVAQYKQRLNPMERSEARFRDALPGLPDVIQIDTSVQTSLDCLEMLSSESIWQRVPAGIRKAKTNTLASDFPPLRSEATKYLAVASRSNPSATSASVLTDITGGDTSDSDSEGSRNPQPGSKSSKLRKKGDKKKANAQSKVAPFTGNPPDPSLKSQEFTEMEQLLQNQQAKLDAGLAESSNRLGAVEEQLQALKGLDEMDEKIGKSMRQHATTNATLDKMQEQQDRMMALIEGMAAATEHRHSQQQAQQGPTIMIPTDSSNSTQQGSLSTLTADALNGQPTLRDMLLTQPHSASPNATQDDSLATTNKSATPTGNLLDSAWSSDLNSQPEASNRTQTTGTTTLESGH